MKVWDGAWINLAAVRLASVARHVTDCAMFGIVNGAMSSSLVQQHSFLLWNRT